MRHVVPVLLLLFYGGCSSQKGLELPVGPDATVSGTVQAIDRTPTAVDSDAVITLRTSAGDTEVYIPARIDMCEAEGLGLFAGLAEGERIEVRGRSLSRGGVRPCASDDHYLRVTSR
ncbi:MAG: hypothetical protein AAGI91_14390 [Bacteroidota bacterium]